jgi:hypothetical protein
MSIALNNDLIRLRLLEETLKNFLAFNFGTEIKGREAINPLVKSMREEIAALTGAIAARARTL